MVEAVDKTGLRSLSCKISYGSRRKVFPKAWQKTTEEELTTQIDLFNKFINTSNERVQDMVWFKNYIR